MSERTPRTFSIWGILAVLVVLGLVGIFKFATGGAVQRTPTQRLPDDPSTTSTTASTTTSSTVPPTMPGGAAAPEGVEAVETSTGQTIYRYRFPESLAGKDIKAMTAPAIAQVTPDGTAVDVAVACAVSDGAVPAEIILTEDPYEVRVIPVAVGLTLGAPCPPAKEIARITMPLTTPLGSRRLVVAPSGSVVNLPGS